MCDKENLIDGLTHINSRRFFEKKIMEMLVESEKENSDLTMLMIDIDNFKLSMEDSVELVERIRRGDTIWKWRIAKRLWAG